MSTQYTIKNENSVTTVALVIDKTNFVSLTPRTIISTQERAGGVAGGPRNYGKVLAEHIAALSAIGAHDEATKIKLNQAIPEAITLGLKTVVSGHYPETK